MKREAFFQAIVVAVILVCFSSAAQADEKIRVGISVPLTGPAATYGTDVKNILLFANEKLGQDKYQFVIEDDKCDSREGVNIAHKFITVDKVDYVLGIPCSGVVLAAGPVYEKSKTVVISALAAAPEVSRVGDYVFRTRPSDAGAGRILFDYISTKHQVFGVLTEETDYALGTTKAFLKASKDSALKILREQFLSNEVDFRPILLRLKSGAALYEEFVESYGELNSFDYTFPTSFEALNALLQAVRSGKNVKESLSNDEFHGLIGRYSFDEHGDIVGFRHVLKRIENGKILSMSQ